MLLCTWGGDLPYTSKTDMIRVPVSPVCVIVQRSALFKQQHMPQFWSLVDFVAMALSPVEMCAGLSRQLDPFGVGTMCFGTMASP